MNKITQGKSFRKQHVRDRHILKSPQQDGCPLVQYWCKNKTKQNRKKPVSLFEEPMGQKACTWEAMLHKTTWVCNTGVTFNMVRCHVMGGTWDRKHSWESDTFIRGHMLFRGKVRQNITTPFSFFNCFFLCFFNPSPTPSPQGHIVKFSSVKGT